MKYWLISNLITLSIILVMVFVLVSPKLLSPIVGVVGTILIVVFFVRVIRLVRANRRHEN